jgi:Lysyl oxidase
LRHTAAASLRRPAAALLPAAIGLTLLAQAGSARPLKRDGSGPCANPNAGHLLCPNLKMAAPVDLALVHGNGRSLLRATSNVESRGLGPMELRGRRSGGRKMSTHQRIYKVGGGHRDFASAATLHFTSVGAQYGGSFWKVHDLANLELWSVDAQHKPLRMVRRSPKLNYCLRDLERTNPGPSSPSSRHYPGCNQNPGRKAVTLGTSVGWSDIYPYDYDKQWIDVTGLRGCFAYVMRVDPAGLLYETNESDNSSQRLVHLPWRGDNGC